MISEPFWKPSQYAGTLRRRRRCRRVDCRTDTLTAGLAWPKF